MKKLVVPRISILACTNMLAWVAYFTWANTRTVDFGGFSGRRGFPFHYWTYTDVGPPFDTYDPTAIVFNVFTLATVLLAIYAVSLWLERRSINAAQQFNAPDASSRPR